jgi:general secretion pathway protein N
MGSTAARALALIAAACAGAALVILTQAPASLLAAAVSARSQGRIDLVDPAGTIWDGSADIVLSPEPIGETTKLRSGGAPMPTRIPGHTAWRIDGWRLLTGTLSLELRNPAALDAPLALRIDLSGAATIDADHLRLPAAVLVGLGAPWNTIRPGGEIALQWDTLHVQTGDVRGRLAAEWVGASSGLSPVVPFGHYRVQADGIFDGAAVQLETLSGPMEMIGSGTIAHGRQLHFHGSARVQAGTDAAVATQLSGLISLLGRRDGDGAILSFGT